MAFDQGKKNKKYQTTESNNLTSIVEPFVEVCITLFCFAPIVYKINYFIRVKVRKNNDFIIIN